MQQGPKEPCDALLGLGAQVRAWTALGKLREIKIGEAHGARVGADEDVAGVDVIVDTAAHDVEALEDCDELDQDAAEDRLRQRACPQMTIKANKSNENKLHQMNGQRDSC